jgi:hypothetical protein
MADLGSAATVQLICLHCKSEFSGRKKPVGNRSRNTFIVKSIGLSLHLRANNCQGLCRKFYKDHNHDINNFFSSVLQIVGLSGPTNFADESQAPSDDCSDAGGIGFECASDSLNLEPNSSDLMNNMINYSSDFRSSLKVKSVISDGHGNTTTTAILSFPSSKSHLLDKVLFHQMHVPYIPNTAVYSPTTFLEGGLSQPPSPDTTSPCTTKPIDDDDLVSVGSSSHDSCGSFQTVEDLENEELVDIFDDE